MPNNSLSGYLLALTAIFFWSLNLIIANYFATSLMPFEIAFGRWLTPSILMLPYIIKAIKTQGKLLWEHRWLIVSLAVTGVVIDNTLIYYAGHTATATDMGLLDVTGPIFLVLLSWFFLKTPLSRKQILGLVIAVFGVITIILQGDFTQLDKVKPVRGDFIMLFNTFSFAVYSLLQAKRPKEISQISMLSLTAVVGVIIILPLMLATVPPARLHSLTGEEIGVMIYLGIFNSTLSYLCWNSALARIGNVKTSIIYYLLPLFSGIEAYFLLGQKFYPAELTGGILVIGGIALVTLGGKIKKARS